MRYSINSVNSLIFGITFVSCLGCHFHKGKSERDDEHQTGDSAIIEERPESHSCGLIVHFKQMFKAEDIVYNSLYYRRDKNNVASFGFIGDVIRIKKNYFVSIWEDYDVDDWEYEGVDGQQVWKKFNARLHWNDKRVPLFERPNEIIGGFEDKAKDRAIRRLFPEIIPETFPLAGEIGYVESPTVFNDASHPIAYYKNIVYIYDGFSVNNLKLSCHGRSEMDKGPECKNIPCIAHVEAYVIDLNQDNTITVKRHRSRKPEYYNGASFVPLYGNPIDESVFLNYDVVKASKYPLFNGENRSFAFYPYPTNGRAEWSKRVWGSTLFAVRENSFGREEMSCTQYYDGIAYDNESVSNYWDQSIILNIPDDKLPATVANIRDEISKAPNGCGYIDWEKQEIVFGEMHQKADWLPFVNGIYWLDEDEEFPVESFKNVQIQGTKQTASPDVSAKIVPSI